MSAVSEGHRMQRVLQAPDRMGQEPDGSVWDGGRVEHPTRPYDVTDEDSLSAGLYVCTWRTPSD